MLITLRGQRLHRENTDIFLHLSLSIFLFYFRRYTVYLRRKREATVPTKVLSAENSSVRISCRKKNCYTKNKLICLIPSLKYLKVLERNKIAYWSIIITYFFARNCTVLPSSIIVQYSSRVNLVFTPSLRTSLPNHEDNGLEEDSSPSQLFFGMSRDAHPKGNGNVAWHPKERLRKRLEKTKKK